MRLHGAGFSEKLDGLITSAENRVAWGTFLLAWLISLLLGLVITYWGFSTLDTLEHIDQMNWLAAKFTGQTAKLSEIVKWYGSLWECVLLVITKLMQGLKDVTWVRHAVTFSLFPVTLMLVYRFVKKVRNESATALLAVALIIGMIRIGGHSVLNVKDFPFACGYLISTLYLWVLVRRMSVAPFTGMKDYVLLFESVFVSLIPYLLRPPVIIHYLVLVGIIPIIACSGPTAKGAYSKFLMPLVTLGGGYALLWIGQPAMWESGIAGWWQSFNKFLSFPWIGQVRIFGRILISNNLPSWYYPAWLVIGIEPISLIVMVVGLICFTVFILPVQMRRLSLDRIFETPTLWLAAFAFIPWVYFIAFKPLVYDEDRHLLFAYPLLAIIGALGFTRFVKTKMPLIIALILVSSAYSYISWGRFSYIYQSPFVRHGRQQEYMGDYWGVGFGAAARRIVDTVPKDANVTVISISELGMSRILKAELERFNSNPFMRRKSSVRYIMSENQWPPAGDVYFVVGSRMDDYLKFLEEIKGDSAVRMIWKSVLPTGEPAGMMFRFSRS